MRRLLATILLTVGLAAPATAGGPDQVVDASPTTDGQAIHRSKVKVVTTKDDTIDTANLAQAHPNSCTGCEGIAVSFQAIIVTGHPSVVRPRNMAAAVNEDCTNCVAYAFAYQYVVGASDHTRLSPTARRQIGDIRRSAADLVDAGLPLDELNSRLTALKADFRTAVTDGIEDPHDGQAHVDADREDG